MKVWTIKVGCQDIEIRKSEFVVKTQFLLLIKFWQLKKDIFSITIGKTNFFDRGRVSINDDSPFKIFVYLKNDWAEWEILKPSSKPSLPTLKVLNNKNSVYLLFVLYTIYVFSARCLCHV